MKKNRFLLILAVAFLLWLSPFRIGASDVVTCGANQYSDWFIYYRDAFSLWFVYCFNEGDTNIGSVPNNAVPIEHCGTTWLKSATGYQWEVTKAGENPDIARLWCRHAISHPEETCSDIELGWATSSNYYINAFVAGALTEPNYIVYSTQGFQDSEGLLLRASDCYISPGSFDDPVDCVGAGFCWEWYSMYLYPFVGGYCTYCDDYECGFDIFSCGACLDEETCTGTDFCTWDIVGKKCLLTGAFECDNTYYQCKNCYNQEECELAGCTWGANGCFFLFPEEPDFEDTDFGLFGNWMRDVLVFLFSPDLDAVLRHIGTTLDSIKQRFPFGYLTHIKLLVEEKLAEAEAEGVQTLPTYSMTFRETELPILNLAEAKENLPDFFSSTRLLIKWVLWFSLLYYLYARITGVRERASHEAEV